MDEPPSKAEPTKVRLTRCAKWRSGEGRGKGQVVVVVAMQTIESLHMTNDTGNRNLCPGNRRVPQSDRHHCRVRNVVHQKSPLKMLRVNELTCGSSVAMRGRAQPATGRGEEAGGAGRGRGRWRARTRGC